MKLSMASFLKIGLACLLIYYLYYTGAFSLEKVKGLIQPSVLFMGLPLIGFVLFSAGKRFQSLSLIHLTTFKSWQLVLMGTFFNFFIPGGVGGDLVKGVVMRKNLETTSTSAAFTVIMDRVLGLATMSFLSVLAFIFVPPHLKSSPKVQVLALFLLLISVFIFLGFYLLVSAEVREKFLFRLIPYLPQKIKNKFLIFHDKQKIKSYKVTQLVKASIWSVLSQMSSILFFFLIGKSLFYELSVSLPVFFFVVPIGFMLTAIPISPGGIGVGQAAFYFLFQRAIGYENELGVVAVSGFQFYQLIWGFLGLYYFIFLKKKVH